MQIPIGRDYSFVVRVLQPDNYLPLDVSGYSGEMIVSDKATDTNVLNCALYPVAPVPDEDGVLIISGLMQGTILSAASNNVVVNKATACDDYYIKDDYKGFISITKAGEPHVNVIIDSIKFVPTGV